jgi:hypothetical protein
MRAADRRTLLLLDGTAVAWVLLWALLGGWTGVTLWHAADAGDTISSSGRALSTVGRGLQGLGELPIVGEATGPVGDRVVATANGISDRGQQLKGQLRRLGVLMGVALLLIPVVPVLGLYLPLRIARHRDVSALRRDVSARPDDPGLDRYLADRARTVLPYRTVVALSGGAVAGSAAGDRRLADAELARLGVRRPTRA